MNKLVFVFSFFLLSVCPYLYGQTSKEEMFKDICKSGGVYYAYHFPKEVHTAVPKGYDAFYICMYCRHGSRYLLGDKDYRDIIALLNKADNQKVLSSLGENVLERLRIVYSEAKNRNGDLSSLGVQQCRSIAERMFNNNPLVFKDSNTISAHSSLIIRTVLSMSAFCERLKELNPQLAISRYATNRDADIMSFHTSRSDSLDLDSSQYSWHSVLKSLESSLIKPQRLVQTLFTDSSFVHKNINPTDLMWNFYWIASDMQNMKSKISFYDLFDKQELFDLWQCFNARFYMTCGNYTNNVGFPLDNEIPLLNNIIKEASLHIKEDRSGANFYFGHDMNLMRLVALIGLEGCDGSSSNPSDFYKVWSDFKIAPMAGNLQIIFYKGSSANDILVKFMLNEQERRLPIKSDVSPYYHWNEVLSYLIKRIQKN